MRLKIYPRDRLCHNTKSIDKDGGDGDSDDDADGDGGKFDELNSFVYMSTVQNNLKRSSKKIFFLNLNLNFKTKEFKLRYNNNNNNNIR